MTPEPITLGKLLSRIFSTFDWDEQDKRARHWDEMKRHQAAMEREQRLRRSGAVVSAEMQRAIVRGELDLQHTKASRMTSLWLPTSTYPVLVLKGPKGCGKSVAAAWWLAQTGGLLRHMSEVSRAWDSSTKAAADARDEMCGTRALVLDDVGTETSRQLEAVRAALRELIECRQASRTLITTNLTPEQWRQRYPDERLASRMLRARWINCDGPDLRGVR